MGYQPDHRPEQVDVCLLNPALLPEWFWTPVANELSGHGLRPVIPALRRGDPTATVEENVDIVEAAMAKSGAQYIVALSRGVEYAVRYLHRLHKQETMQKMLGCLIISSVGPRGYEVADPRTGEPFARHTSEYVDGLYIDDRGLQNLRPDAAVATMFHDVDDPRLCEQAVADLVSERPLSQTEIDEVPRLPRGLVPTSWIIGMNDRVDNRDLSAAVALQRFGATPIYEDWGHVGPLSHTSDVTKLIVTEVGIAASQRDGSSTS